MRISGLNPSLMRPTGHTPLPSRYGLQIRVPQKGAIGAPQLSRWSRNRENIQRARRTHVVKASASKGVQVVKVSTGDSAWELARKHSVSVTELAALNPTVDMSALRVGQNLVVPHTLVQRSALQTEPHPPAPRNEPAESPSSPEITIPFIAQLRQYATNASRHVMTTTATTTPAIVPPTLVGVTR